MGFMLERENNFYLGGEVGYAMQKANFLTTYSSAFIPPSFVTSTDVTYEDKGMLFGLIGGWQYRFMRWMFGLEASVDFTGHEKNRPFNYTPGPDSDAHVTGTILYDRGDAYGIAGRVGYFVTPFFMPYIKVGAQYSRDELNYVAFYGEGTPPGSATLGKDFLSKREGIWAWLGGVGMEFPTYIGSSTIRFEYNYTRAQSLSINASTAAASGLHKFQTPYTHTGKVAWVWNFC
jgi:opacity protein-like surface antigen